MENKSTSLYVAVFCQKNNNLKLEIMFKSNVFVLILISGMLMAAIQISSCGSKSDQVNKEQYLNDVSTTEDAPSGDYFADQKNKGSAGEKDESRAYEETNPGVAPPPPTAADEKIPTKVIKTADVSYQVETFNSSRKAILSIVNRYKGVVSSENQTNDGYRLSNTMTIRIDAASFDSLVEALMVEAIYVEHKTINAQDVTEEFVDLTARMKSKKEVEAQYSEILKKARTINEILEVTEYLRAIREEIESVEGRLKYINDRVSYSAITLTYYEQLDVVSQQPDRTFGSRMGEAFSWGWNGLVNFFLGIIYLWPLWLLMGATAWLVYFLIKRGARRRAARKAKATTQA